MFVLMQPLGGRWSVSMLDVWGLSSIWSLEQLGTGCSEAQMHCRLEWTLVVACASAPDDQRCWAGSQAPSCWTNWDRETVSRHSEFSRVFRCQETLRCSSSLGLNCVADLNSEFSASDKLRSQVFCIGFMFVLARSFSIVTWFFVGLSPESYPFETGGFGSTASKGWPWKHFFAERFGSSRIILTRHNSPGFVREAVAANSKRFEAMKSYAKYLWLLKS